MAISLRKVLPVGRLLLFGNNATAIFASDAINKVSVLRNEGSFLSNNMSEKHFQSSIAAETNAAETNAAETNAAAKELYNRHRKIMFLNGKEPDVAVDAWIAPNASLIGDVVVEDRSTIWYGCVLRGDLNSIRVATFSNILDKTCIHAARTSPTGLSAETNIGKFVTIGSNCSIRSAAIEDEVIIGHRCVIMEGSIVETHAILKDGTVLPPGRRIPAGQVWGGSPAQFVRNVTYDEIAEIKKIAEKIQLNSFEHSEEFLPYSAAYIEAEKLKETLSKLSA